MGDFLEIVVSRRHLAIALLSLFAFTVFACATQPKLSAPPSGIPATANLRDLADGVKLSLGAAVMPDFLAEPEYRATLIANYNYISPENDLKWESVHPARDVYDFRRGDELADFARANGMAFRGHTLVWHNQNPAWLKDGEFSGAELEAILEGHIASVAGHFKGRVRDWDVVNEVVGDDGKLRDTLWLRGIGEDYIAKAFRWARAADPAAALFINDYGAEGPGPKADGLYALVKGLVAAGVPIDGVGFQAHLVGQAGFDLRAVAANFARFKALGLQVQVTELDVRLPDPPSAGDLAVQADIVSGLARLCLASDASAMVFWGVGDKHSWIPGVFKGYVAPLLFDESYARKPCADALAAVLSGPRPGPGSLSGAEKSGAFAHTFATHGGPMEGRLTQVDGAGAGEILILNAE